MQKQFTFLIFFLFFSVCLFAQPIDENTARNVAQTFFGGQGNTAGRAADLELVYKATSKALDLSAKPKNQETYYYVFNAKANSGFVIVSGDERAIPILGYSDAHAFDNNNVPPNVMKWLEGYKNEIRQIIKKESDASSLTHEQWRDLKAGRVRSQESGRVKAVNPLLQTRWNQSPFYNALAPDNSVAGCVATAMAQVMKYWEYPANGSGFHSYNHSEYGTLSANFGATTYDWDNMPAEVTSANSAVATLLYHCGVSVDMNFSPQSSGAYVISTKSQGTYCAEYALKTHFGYDNTLQGIERENYTQGEWDDIIRTELEEGRPILYAGFGNGSGHAFVCDGYDNNNFFHFNWGWGGNSDGYYSLTALNPVDLGTGAGNGSYNSNQQAVIGIQPPPGVVTFDLSLYDYVTTPNSTIAFGQAFSVSTNIVNHGANAFNGDFSAAVFDNASNFVGFIETKVSQSLPGGHSYNDNLVFSSDGMLSMLPGTYSIGIFFKPTDGEWTQVSDNGDFTNYMEITVVNENDISLNSAMEITPGVTLTQGQPVSVNLNIVNIGSETFIGQYDISLYNLDGTHAQTIQTIDESEGLPGGYTYLEPYLIFSNSSITVPPGTYFLAALHYSESAGWALTGTGDFQNPITVTVSAPPIQMDVYENNDDVTDAFNLPFTINANIETSGSNCHTGSDYDYYKIVLPAGAEYEVTARIHDGYNSGTSETYTLDALVSYSTDKSTWSDAYDDVISEDIRVAGGKTIYFHVAPYFVGENGTYLLDVSVKELNVTAVEPDAMDDQIKIYPNPAKKFISIDGSSFAAPVHAVALTNMQGQEFFNTTEIRQNSVTIPVAHLTEGLYVLQLLSGKRVITKKIIVTK